MDRDVPLPPPPRVRHRSPAGSTSLPRKTTPVSQPRVDDHSSLPSSDLALFSSDDIPASSLDNYSGPLKATTKKRRYRGTWWGEVVMRAKKKRMSFKEKRNLDSGVWMASDESSSSELSFSVLRDASSCEESLRSTTHATITAPGIGVSYETVASNGISDLHGGRQLFQRRLAIRRVEEPKAHLMAREIVSEYLERGQDGVDLSNVDLRTIPPGLLQPLLHLTKQPVVTEGPVADDLYSPLAPFLRLFLSGNSLTELGSEVFELVNLRVLSVRNNQLTEFPCGIRKLTMLQELNVSVNRLQYLPWEILWLIRNGNLKRLVVHPNPFLRPDQANVHKWHYHSNNPGNITLPSPNGELYLAEYEGPTPEEGWAPIHIATGPIRRFNMEGFSVMVGKSCGVSEGHSTLTGTKSRVPSLRDLVLLKCSHHIDLDQFLDSDLSDYPGLVVRLLKQARDARNAGGRCCSICHRSFVIARTEWIEWWDCTTYENGLKGPRPPGLKLRPLPFLRRGCSWACIPGAEDGGNNDRNHITPA